MINVFIVFLFFSLCLIFAKVCSWAWSPEVCVKASVIGLVSLVSVRSICPGLLVVCVLGSIILYFVFQAVFDNFISLEIDIFSYQIVCIKKGLCAWIMKRKKNIILSAQNYIFNYIYFLREPELNNSIRYEWNMMQVSREKKEIVRVWRGLFILRNHFPKKQVWLRIHQTLYSNDNDI